MRDAIHSYPYYTAIQYHPPKSCSDEVRLFRGTLCDLLGSPENRRSLRPCSRTRNSAQGPAISAPFMIERGVQLHRGGVLIAICGTEMTSLSRAPTKSRRESSKVPSTSVLVYFRDPLPRCAPQNPNRFHGLSSSDACLMHGKQAVARHERRPEQLRSGLRADPLATREPGLSPECMSQTRVTAGLGTSRCEVWAGYTGGRLGADRSSPSVAPSTPRGR